MDCHSPKLSLDLSPPWLHTPPQPSSSVATGALEEMKRVDESSSSMELNKNIARLEAELRKIEAFKRELPLSVLILNEAIEKLKEEATGNQKGLSTSAEAAAAAGPDNYCWKLGLKLESYEENDRTDKKSWMSSAQLWSSGGGSGGGGEGDDADRTSFLQLKSANKQEPDDSNSDTVLECNYNSTFGVRTSIDKERLSLASTTTSVPDVATAPATSLSLNNSGELRQVPAAHEPAAARKSVVVRSEGRQRISGGHGITDQVRKSVISPSTPIQHQQQHGGSTFKSCGRKQRRCWSPELHRRFVDALEKLGGSQVATPKQIREVMQVDGLTNDEVKSHLQKYRLHVRKLPNTTMSLSRSGEEEDSDGHEQDSNSKSRNSRCKDDDSDVNQSASPEGPLHLLSVLRRSSKSNSGASRCDYDNSLEEEEEEEEMRDAEEERSDGMSIRKGHHY